MNLLMNEVNFLLRNYIHIRTKCINSCQTVAIHKITKAVFLGGFGYSPTLRTLGPCGSAKE